MQGVYLKFYVQEGRRHHGVLAYEWLLETAKKAGIHGGSAFRAMPATAATAACMRSTSSNSPGDLPIEVGFALEEHDAKTLLGRLTREDLELFCVKLPIEMGVVGRQT